MNEKDLEDSVNFFLLGAKEYEDCNFQAAIHEFRKSLELKKDWKTYQGLGSALFKSNQIEEAIDALNNSISLQEDWSTYQSLGWAFMNQCKFEKSYEAFQKSISLKEEWNSYQGLGWTLIRQNNFTEAKDAFEKYFNLAPLSHLIPVDSKLEILISASRYTYFPQRLVMKGTDIKYYKPIQNELAEFISLCPWETECLYKFAGTAKKGIVEIGRLKGGSTLLFSMSNPKTRVISIDISPQNDENLKYIFSKLSCGENVELLTGDSIEVYKDIVRIGFEYDFIFIDGDHTYEGCLKDLNTWFPSLEPGGIIAIHDTYMNPVYEAIMQFLRHNDMDFIVPPCMNEKHWENPNGSLCIARKRVN